MAIMQVRAEALLQAWRCMYGMVEGPDKHLEVGEDGAGARDI